jgi:hypothetical protein
MLLIMDATVNDIAYEPRRQSNASELEKTGYCHSRELHTTADAVKENTLPSRLIPVDSLQTTINSV